MRTSSLPWIRATLVAHLVALAVRAAPSESDRLNEEGIALLSEGDAAAAVSRFEAALESRPGERTLRRNLAAALAEVAEERRRTKRAAEAVDLLHEAIRLHPERLRYRVLRGRARYEAGRRNDRFLAREDFLHVLERDADNLDALVNLGQIAYMERRLPEAVRSWRHALLLRPRDRDISARLQRAERELEVEESYERLVARSFIVRFGPSISREFAESVLSTCETAYGELSVRFQHWPDSRTVVTIYTPGEFRSATRLHAWVAGLSDGTIRLTARPGAAPESVRDTIYHEYAHHLVRSLAGDVPPWLQEGLAQLAEGRSVQAAEARLRSAKKLPVSDLSVRILLQSDPRVVEVFYDMSLSFTHHLEELGKGRGILELLRHLGEGQSEGDALKLAFGAGREDLFAAWIERLRGR